MYVSYSVYYFLLSMKWTDRDFHANFLDSDFEPGASRLPAERYNRI